MLPAAQNAFFSSNRAAHCRSSGLLDSPGDSSEVEIQAAGHFRQTKVSLVPSYFVAPTCLCTLQGLLPAEKMPQVMNPKDGFVATANCRVAEDPQEILGEVFVPG